MDRPLGSHTKVRAFAGIRCAWLFPGRSKKHIRPTESGIPSAVALPDGSQSALYDLEIGIGAVRRERTSVAGT